MKNRNAMDAIRIVALFILLFTALGCGKKSARDITEENAIKRHNQEVQAAKNFRFSAELKQAVDFLVDLRAQGKLPGVTTNDDGSWHVNKMPDALPDGRIAQEFHVTVTTAAPPRYFYYVVAENTNNGKSQLSKACRTDASGNVIEQYPVQ